MEGFPDPKPLGVILHADVAKICFQWIIIQASSYYQPKQCTIIMEIPQNCHRFVLFDSPKIGILMTHVLLPCLIEIISFSDQPTKQFVAGL